MSEAGAESDERGKYPKIWPDAGGGGGGGAGERDMGDFCTGSDGWSTDLTSHHPEAFLPSVKVGKIVSGERAQHSTTSSFHISSSDSEDPCLSHTLCSLLEIALKRSASSSLLALTISS